MFIRIGIQETVFRYALRRPFDELSICECCEERGAEPFAAEYITHDNTPYDGENDYSYICPCCYADGYRCYYPTEEEDEEPGSPELVEEAVEENPE
jgi:hypothetical protein